MSKVTFHKHLPQTPGVYIMKDARGRILYVGKAGNLRRRVASYFSRAHEARIEKLVNEINKIEHRETDTVIEALVLEAVLIKKYLPPYNIKEKDDKSFLFVEVTHEEWPRVMLVRGKDLVKHSVSDNSNQQAVAGTYFGPFTSAASIREALKILRRIFPYNTHPNPAKAGRASRPCLDYELGLCPGACLPTSQAKALRTGAELTNKKEYAATLRHLKLFFRGGKKKIITALKKEMAAASKREEYERAEKLKRRIFALTHIQDAALIGSDENWELKSTSCFVGARTLRKVSPSACSSFDEIENSAKRLEGYDISNISGTSAVGSMVVFAGGVPDKSQYRKFKIRTVRGANDVAMLREVLTRRFRHSLGRETSKWPRPDLILVDGGLPQVNAARVVLATFKLNIPLVGLAKGPDRKNNALVGDKIPAWTNLATIIRLRDEAHRFAISYHRQLRGRL